MPKAGDKVSITTEDETITGILMPGDKSHTVLKLDSGYNMGILAKRVKRTKLLEAHTPSPKAEGGHTHMPGLPLISILHTGGTIASKVDYETGGVIARYSPAELLAMFPELKNIANIESRLIRNMFSEDMRFAHYNILAKEISSEIAKGAKGVIVTHGTDTLHYTAAALAFMVRPAVPVILVGAQRSSDRGSSDAAINLLCAAAFITKTEFGGVAVCMHEKIDDDSCLILPACRCRKNHSSRRDAFQAVNGGPLARVKYPSLEIEKLSELKTQENSPITLIDEKLKIGMLYAHPNMRADELKAYEKYDGLVVLGTGLGHLPINAIDDETKEHTKIYNVLKKLAKDTAVVMTTQALSGTVHLDVYATGRLIKNAGVQGNATYITPEAAFIKLAWLLTNHRQHWTQHWDQDICGELGKGNPE